MVLIELVIELIIYILMIFKIYGLLSELPILFLGYRKCLLFDSQMNLYSGNLVRVICSYKLKMHTSALAMHINFCHS